MVNPPAKSGFVATETVLLHLKQPHSASPQFDWPERRRQEAYWPEIDGLRTIAIGSVFIYHLDGRLLGGGFTGVDIFFVISGYLITTLLMADISSGSFGVYKFYQRRIARLAPASLLVVAVALIGGSLLYSTHEFAVSGMHGIAASLSLMNVKLLLQGNYFNVSSDAQPLLHYWSLSVEEQFYLIFPVFLYFMMKTRYLLVTLLLCCGASFALCAATTALAPAAAFYLLPTRAWELLAGSSLAVFRKRGLKLDERTSSRCLAAGLILILLSLAMMRSEGFPGWIASVPVAGSVLMLAGIDNGRGVIQRALAHPAMVFTGRRSYSLYLWHWPVFSFIDYRFFLFSPALLLALKFIAAIGAAVASYRFLERPARLWLNAAPRPGPVFGAFFAAAAGLAIISGVIRHYCYLGADPASVATGGISVNGGGHARVAVVGDSKGAMYSRELASIARARGLRLDVLSAMGENELQDEPETLWPAVSRFLDAARPDVVIVAQAWSLKLHDAGKEQFKSGISALLDRAASVIVITEPPVAPPEAMRPEIRAGARPPFFEHAGEREGRMRADAIVHGVESERVQVVDVADLFLNADNSLRAVGPDGRLVFMDSHHLADAGTALVRPRLEQALRRALHGGERP